MTIGTVTDVTSRGLTSNFRFELNAQLGVDRSPFLRSDLHVLTTSRSCGEH